MASEKVTLYLYDLSRGLAKMYSQQLTGQQFEGIWHTAIVVYGTEYYYASGIQTAVPGQTHHGQPYKTFDMGETFIPKEVFLEFLQDISPRYTDKTYDLFEHNCNNFSNEVSQFLTGKNIPEFITNLPREALNTPLGPIVKQFSQAIANQINNPGSNGDTYGTIQNGIQNLASVTSNGNNDALVNLLGNIGRSTDTASNSSMPPQNMINTVSDDKFANIRTIKKLSELNETIKNHSFIIIDFTMARCPPCHAIAPVFSKMLDDRLNDESFQKASPVPNLVALKIDIRQCEPLIPQYYGVTATPTFAFIKNGKEMARIVGANRNEIEKKMDEIFKEAKNSKPCIKLNMQNRAIPLEQYSFDQINNFATVITDLKTSLLSSNKIEQTEWDSLMTVKYHLNDKPDPNNTITDECINVIQKSIDLLKDNEVLPLLEIVKKLFLNNKVKETLVTKKDKTILKLIKKFTDNNETPIQTLLLKTLCNWCNELESVKYLLNDNQYEDESNKSLFVNYLTNSLLSENKEIVSIALKLLNNVSLFKQYINIDDEERDINIISAIVQLLQNEELLKTSVSSVLSSFYLYIFENKQSSVTDLLDVFNINSIINNITKSLEEEMKSSEDANVKKEKELLRDLGNRIIAMIEYIKN
jgi:thiol-disulfide isomerase/thioredoxin